MSGDTRPNSEWVTRPEYYDYNYNYKYGSAQSPRSWNSQETLAIQGPSQNCKC